MIDIILKLQISDEGKLIKIEILNPETIIEEKVGSKELHELELLDGFLDNKFLNRIKRNRDFFLDPDIYDDWIKEYYSNCIKCIYIEDLVRMIKNRPGSWIYNFRQIGFVGKRETERVLKSLGYL